MAAVLIQLGNVLNQSFINPSLINTVVREGIPGKSPFLLDMAQIIPALARSLANCFSFKEVLKIILGQECPPPLHAIWVTL